MVGQTAHSRDAEKHIIIKTPLRGTPDGRKCRLKLIGTVGPVQPQLFSR
jgi:hypothetical protein